MKKTTIEINECNEGYYVGVIVLDGKNVVSNFESQTYYDKSDAWFYAYNIKSSYENEGYEVEIL